MAKESEVISKATSDDFEFALQSSRRTKRKTKLEATKRIHDQYKTRAQQPRVEATTKGIASRKRKAKEETKIESPIKRRRKIVHLKPVAITTAPNTPETSEDEQTEKSEEEGGIDTDAIVEILSNRPELMSPGRPTNHHSDEIVTKQEPRHRNMTSNNESAISSDKNDMNDLFNNDMELESITQNNVHSYIQQQQQQQQQTALEDEVTVEEADVPVAVITRRHKRRQRKSPEIPLQAEVVNIDDEEETGNASVELVEPVSENSVSSKKALPADAVGFDDDESGDYKPNAEEESIYGSNKRDRLRPSTRSQRIHSEFLEKTAPTGKILLDVTGNIQITDTDLDRLREGQFLNDNIIDYWYQQISSEFEQYKSRFHIFNTHFYPLVKKDPQRAAVRVDKNEKLLEKDLIFIPICEGSHWVLIVICHLPNLFLSTSIKPFLMYCDSLGAHHSRRMVTCIRDYIVKRYNFEKNETLEHMLTNELPTRTAVLPLQENHCDCGIYVLQYIEETVRRFFEQDEKDKLVVQEEFQSAEESSSSHKKSVAQRFVLPIKDNTLFSSTIIAEKRLIIRDKILELAVNAGTITEDEAVVLRERINVLQDDVEIEEEADERSSPPTPGPEDLI